MGELSAGPSGGRHAPLVPALGIGRSAERRQAARLELDRLLDEIRQDPPGAGFLRPPETGRSSWSTSADSAATPCSSGRPGWTPSPLPALGAFGAEQRVRSFYDALETLRHRTPARHRREAESAVKEVPG